MRLVFILRLVLTSNSPWLSLRFKHPCNYTKSCQLSTHQLTTPPPPPHNFLLKIFLSYHVGGFNFLAQHLIADSLPSSGSTQHFWHGRRPPFGTVYLGNPLLLCKCNCK